MNEEMNIGIKYIDIDYMNKIKNEYEKGEWINVFNLWVLNQFCVPFRVVRRSWSSHSCFEVKIIEICDNNWKYFKETGNLYGKAFGNFLSDNIIREKDIELNCGGCYQWRFCEDVRGNKK